MNEIDVKIHKIGEITDALTGKPADGLVVSFGEFKQTALSWKSFKQLIGLRCPKAEAMGTATGHTTSHGTGSSGPAANGTVNSETKTNGSGFGGPGISTTDLVKK